MRVGEAVVANKTDVAPQSTWFQKRRDQPKPSDEEGTIIILRRLFTRHQRQYDSRESNVE